MTAIAILAAFLAGAMAGTAVLLRVGMASEASDKPLARKPPARSALATRVVVGLYVLTPQSISPAEHAADQPGNAQRQLPPGTGSRR